MGGVPTYVAFLRAINLGRNRKFPMAALRALLEREGFDGVETWIQTGNVRLRSSLRSPQRLATRLGELFEADRGFAVPTVVLTPAELRQVYVDAQELAPPPRLESAEVRRYVTLLKDDPPRDAVEEIHALELEGEAARVRGRAVHVWVRDGYQNARIDNTRIERSLGVATTRDLKVITALADRWGA
ncbi:MAG: DUF1697 domain-containing protein [Actinomycetes bacterium]